MERYDVLVVGAGPAGSATAIHLARGGARTLLVDKASCESPNLKLVDASGGDQGLAHSWLWQKLTAPADSSGKLETKADWGTAAGGCNQESGMGFGLRMPLSGSADQLTDTKLKAIRNWICAGAPKP